MKKLIVFLFVAAVLCAQIDTGGAGGGGGSGTVTGVLGTANQITSDGSATTPTLSIPSTFTFPGTVTNNLSIFASTTSAQLATLLSNETGSGLAVFGTTPTLTTPVLGVATATSINKVALTAPAIGSTLTVADGKTLTASNTLTLTGTDSSSVAFGAGGTVAYTVFAGTKALATSAIASGACTSAQTVAATGTLTTDVISAGFNGDPTGVTGFVPLSTGMLTLIVYPSADTVNIKECNNTASSITPGAMTLNVRVAR